VTKRILKGRKKMGVGPDEGGLRNVIERALGRSGRHNQKPIERGKKETAGCPVKTVFPASSTELFCKWLCCRSKAEAATLRQKKAQETLKPQNHVSNSPTNSTLRNEGGPK